MLGHAIHTTAICRLRFPHTEGSADLGHSAPWAIRRVAGVSGVVIDG